MLRVNRCVLFVACCQLVVVCCVWCIVYVLLRSMPFVVCCVMCDGCGLLFV